MLVFMLNFICFQIKMLLRIVVLVALLVTLATTMVSSFIIVRQSPVSLYSRYRYALPLGHLGGMSGLGGTIGSGPMLLYNEDIDWNT